MNKLFGSICLSDIPKELIKTGRNGKKYLSVIIGKKRVPSAYGKTHYMKVDVKFSERKDGVNYYIGDFKSDEAIEQQTRTAALTQQQAPNFDDLPF